MPRFAANLTMLFTEYPLIERYERAAAAGFHGAELLFPADEDIDAIADALARLGLEQVLFNLPAGNFAAGERGFANDPDRVDEFRAGVERALAIAERLGCRRLNCLVGLQREDVPLDLQWETVAGNLRYAAERAGAAGITQLVEPLNDIDTPGFLLTTTRQALALLERVGHPNLKIQYDAYHMQRMEGNLIATIRAQLARIGHIQIADSPDRNQPGSGEINYAWLLPAIDAAGYDGWVSLEYRPLGGSEASLAWFREWIANGAT